MTKIINPDFNNNNNKDKVFETDGPIADFKFDKTVANVFDDMVSRSVPYYNEIQRMACELGNDFAQDNTNIYDIGCSTGTTIELLDKFIKNKKVNFIGLDNSEDMIKKAQEKLSNKLNNPFDIKYADINSYLDISNASVIMLLLTLQFVRPLYREKIAKNLYSSLNEGGALILVEKLTCQDTNFNRLFIEHYYDYKRRNGYSDVEISKKREALENVLIPYRVEENYELLSNAGFKKIETFFRWYNFCGIIAVK
jgi:tRNA (cmo5U34)-methyltransferase